MSLHPIVALAAPLVAAAQVPEEGPVEVSVTVTGSEEEPLPDPRLPIRVVGNERVRMDEPSEDLFAMGQEVVLEARVADNAFLMAQEVRIDAPVDGDVFAMGENVRVSAPISGDLYAMGAQVRIVEGGSVKGSVSAAAGEVVLGGPVGGDLSIGAGRVRIDSAVGGDASLDVGELVLGEGAAIRGDLAYEAPREVDGADAATGGRVTFTLEVEDVEEPEPEPGFLAQMSWRLMWLVWSYTSKLLVGSAFLALGGAAAGGVARGLVQQPARALGLGFVVMCVVPVASIVSIALIVPLPLGLLGLVGLAVAMYGAQILTAQAMGDLILRRFRPGALGSPYISMAVGLAPLVIVASIPWLGVLAWYAASVAGIGALWLAIRQAATSSPAEA